MENENFSTHDLALAAALVTFGHGLSDLKRNAYGARATFIFNKSEDFDRLIQTYWSDELLVSPRQYFDAVKHLKTRLYLRDT